MYIPLPAPSPLLFFFYFLHNFFFFVHMYPFIFLFGVHIFIFYMLIHLSFPIVFSFSVQMPFLPSPFFFPSLLLMCMPLCRLLTAVSFSCHFPFLLTPFSFSLLLPLDLTWLLPLLPLLPFQLFLLVFASSSSVSFLSILGSLASSFSLGSCFLHVAPVSCFFFPLPLTPSLSLGSCLFFSVLHGSLFSLGSRLFHLHFLPFHFRLFLSLSTSAFCHFILSCFSPFPPQRFAISSSPLFLNLLLQSAGRQEVNQEKIHLEIHHPAHYCPETSPPC